MNNNKEHRDPYERPVRITHHNHKMLTTDVLDEALRVIDEAWGEESDIYEDVLAVWNKVDKASEAIRNGYWDLIAAGMAIQRFRNKHFEALANMDEDADHSLYNVLETIREATEE